MIYGLVLLCMYMYCCMGEKCPFRGQNLGSVLWVSPLRIHLKLHKSGVPGLWRDKGYTQYLYSSFYSVFLKKNKKIKGHFILPFVFCPFLLRSRKKPAQSLLPSFPSLRQIVCPQLKRDQSAVWLQFVTRFVRLTMQHSCLVVQMPTCWYGLAVLCMDQSRLTRGRRDLLPSLGCEILLISLQLQPYPALQWSCRQPGEFLSAPACGVLPNLPPICAFWDLIFLRWGHSLMMTLRCVRADDRGKTCMQITKEIMVMHCSFLQRS